LNRNSVAFGQATSTEQVSREIAAKRIDLAVRDRFAKTLECWKLAALLARISFWSTILINSGASNTT